MPAITDKLREEFESEISSSLADIVNPRGVVGSVIGETEGIFGCENWEIYSASRLAAISTAIAAIKDNRKEGELFYKKILDYVLANVGEVSETQLAAADKAALRVSHCQEGVTGQAALYHKLKKDKFFDKLKLVYVTLEILTSVNIDYDKSLPTNSIDALKEHLTLQEAMFIQEVSAGGMGQKFKRKQYQLNKYQALLQNYEKGYADASELLSGFDVEEIKQTIIGRKIMYRSPL